MRILLVIALAFACRATESAPLEPNAAEPQAIDPELEATLPQEVTIPKGSFFGSEEGRAFRKQLHEDVKSAQEWWCGIYGMGRGTSVVVTPTHFSYSSMESLGVVGQTWGRVAYEHGVLTFVAEHVAGKRHFPHDTLYARHWAGDVVLLPKESLADFQRVVVRSERMRSIGHYVRRADAANQLGGAAR